MSWFQGRTFWWIVYVIQVLFVLAVGLRAGWVLRRLRYPLGDLNSLYVYQVSAAIRGMDAGLHTTRWLAGRLKWIFTASIRYLAGMSPDHVKGRVRVPMSATGAGAWVNCDPINPDDWGADLAKILIELDKHGMPPWWKHWFTHTREALGRLKTRCLDTERAGILLDMLDELETARRERVVAQKATDFQPLDPFGRDHAYYPHIRTDPPPLFPVTGDTPQQGKVITKSVVAHRK